MSFVRRLVVERGAMVFLSRFAVCCLLALLVAACEQKPTPDAQAEHAPLPGSGQIVLPEHSPKRGYIKETVAELVPRPVMEPLPGTLVYDETRTVGVRPPASPLEPRLLAVRREEAA